MRTGQQYGPLRVIEDKGYKLTDQALKELRQAKVSETVVAKLAPLKDKELSREEIQKELVKVLDSEEIKQFQNTILNHSKDNAVSPADRIIVDGLLRVRQGVKVDPKEFETPKPKEPVKSPAAASIRSPDPAREAATVDRVERDRGGNGWPGRSVTRSGPKYSVVIRDALRESPCAAERATFLRFDTRSC